MKLSKKLITIISATLLLTPVATSLVQEKSVLATKIYNTYGKNSRVKLNKTVKFVNKSGKKTNKVAKKGGRYTVWNVKKINGKYYFSIQTNLKYWLPASATTGSVKYKNTTIKTYAGSVTVKTTNSKIISKTTYDPVNKSKKIKASDVKTR